MPETSSRSRGSLLGHRNCCGRKQGFLKERELGGIPGPILRIEIKQICRRNRIRDKHLSESGQTESSYAEIFSERPTQWELRAAQTAGPAQFHNKDRALSQSRIPVNESCSHIIILRELGVYINASQSIVQRAPDHDARKCRIPLADSGHQLTKKMFLFLLMLLLYMYYVFV